VVQSTFTARPFSQKISEIVCAGAALFAASLGSGCAEKQPVPTPSAGSSPTPVTPPPAAPPPAPYSFHQKAWDIYIPSTFSAGNGRYDLVIHFHGMPSLERRALEQAGVEAIVVAVNHGAFAGNYEEPYKDPQALDHILAFVDEQLVASGRNGGGKLGRLALSAWSAGAGSVARILGVPGNPERIDAVLLADGLFTSYRDPKRKLLNPGPLERFVTYAQAAARGEKLFVVTHSAVPTYGYPNMQETTSALLSMSAFERKPVDVMDASGMHRTSECHVGSFHLMGFAGDGVQAHMDHVQKMGELSWPYLRSRWATSTAHVH
jgi:hypothetical protein